MSIRQGSTIIAGSTPVKSVPIIGEIKKVCGTANYVPEGCLQCNGTEFRGDQFSDLWTNYLTSTPAKLNVCTYAEYSNQLNTYGFCNSFAVDTVNQTFKVPTRNSYRKLVKKYVNGNDWYNLYDDGWVEQGGKAIGTEATTVINYQVTFKIPYNNTNYFVSGDIEADLAYVSTSSTPSYDSVANRAMSINRKTTTGFYINNLYYKASDTSGAGHKTWKACGYTSVPDTTANIDREFVCVANGFVNASTFDWSTWQNGLNAKLDKNLGNSTNITNCITNIPQDINLELSNGTLTLKAGSKVYVPNGSGVFDTVTISSDLTLSSYGSGSTDFMVFYNTNTGVLQPMAVSVCYSGDTEPYTPTTSTDGVWYDTANNYVKFENTAATTWTSGLSFPLCVCSRSSGTPSSINNVFNGFGYIGSTVFVLPGVKGLIPNGRNSDGSLKNLEYITSRVTTWNLYIGDTNGRTCTLFVEDDELSLGIFGVVNDIMCRRVYNQETAPTISDTQLWYKPSENQWYGLKSGSTWTKVYPIIFQNSIVYSSNVTNWKEKTCFHALDYNDKETIVGWGMPSDKYVELTPVSSGSTYTMPANGWFSVNGKDSGATGTFYMVIRNHTRYFGIASGDDTTSLSPAWRCYFLPVKKGDVIYIYVMGTIAYNATNFATRFYYAEGESS